MFGMIQILQELSQKEEDNYSTLNRRVTSLEAQLTDKSFLDESRDDQKNIDIDEYAYLNDQIKEVKDEQNKIKLQLYHYDQKIGSSFSEPNGFDKRIENL